MTPWAVALAWSFGALVLICCVIALWPRKEKPLGSAHYSVGRDCFREFTNARKG